MADSADITALVPGELLVAFAQHQQAAKQHKPEQLPDNPEIAAALRASIAQHSQGTARPADAPLSSDINSMLNEFHDKTDTIAPKARYKGGRADVYVIPDPDIGMMSSTDYDSPDGKTLKSSALAIIVNSGTMNPPDPSLRLTHDELKVIVAHEYGHNLIELNPELMDDPRFRPRGEQFGKELEAHRARMDRDHLTPEQKQEKEDHFFKEAAADNIALWLTRDPGAMQRAQDKTYKMHSELTYGAREPGSEDLPSAAARTGNRQETERVIEAAGKPKPVQKQGQQH